MTCPTCGSCRHTLHNDLTRARWICRDCGHLGRWMDEPEWRTHIAVIIDAMRGAPAVLREMADRAENQAA